MCAVRTLTIMLSYSSPAISQHFCFSSYRSGHQASSGYCAVIGYQMYKWGIHKWPRACGQRLPCRDCGKKGISSLPLLTAGATLKVTEFCWFLGVVICLQWNWSILQTTELFVSLCHFFWVFRWWRNNTLHKKNWELGSLKCWVMSCITSADSLSAAIRYDS